MKANNNTTASWSYVEKMMLGSLCKTVQRYNLQLALLVEQLNRETHIFLVCMCFALLLCLQNI